jgi:hypothetical protein
VPIYKVYFNAIVIELREILSNIRVISDVDSRILSEISESEKP